MKRPARTWCAALLGLLLAGCSSTTFLYNRLDFIVPWYVGGYVDLDREQKRQLAGKLEPFLFWHREVELPAYLGILDKANAALDGDVSEEQLAALGETLSQVQLAQFIDRLREEQREFEEDDLSRDDTVYRQDVLGRLEDNLEDYLGRLQPGQRDMLAVAVARLRRGDGVWLGERARWLDRLQALLQREPGWQDDLRQAIATREEFNSALYREIYEHNAAVVYAALAEVLNSRSERQDDRLRRKLLDLREDLEVLIGQAPEQTAAVRRPGFASG